MKKKNWWKDESGATSVLVIFMMIVLVTLGAMAIVSANVNYKFSVRTLDWNKTYFLLDSKAEAYVRDVDLCLADAETKAVAYMLAAGYDREEYEGVRSEVQDEIYALCQETSSDKTIPLQFAMEVIYWYYADENLNQLTVQYPEQEILSLYNRDMVSGITVGAGIRPEDDSDAGIRVELSVMPVNIDLSVVDNHVTGTKQTNRSRYEIQQWSEYQKEFEAEETHDVWQGFIGEDNPDFEGKGIFDEE